MKKRILQVLAISFLAFGFTSCKKCKDCEIKVDLTSSYGLTDADCQATFGMNCEDYLTQGYDSQEYCGDDLEAIEETDAVTGVGYSVYWECK
ncbi:MAG: hypothetical protein CMD16_02385 [Flavobacteriales bacterium]|nr:hypothetical protein [Flavobacteriales bacterium]|tara:strand:- start:14197 stop:14472 length:276 start_codon:yes stop_codon:yes gene_type:complete